MKVGYQRSPGQSGWVSALRTRYHEHDRETTRLGIDCKVEIRYHQSIWSCSQIPINIASATGAGTGKSTQKCLAKSFSGPRIQAWRLVADRRDREQGYKQATPSRARVKTAKDCRLMRCALFAGERWLLLVPMTFLSVQTAKPCSTTFLFSDYRV